MAPARVRRPGGLALPSSSQARRGPPWVGGRAALDSFSRMLWWLFASSAGAGTRAAVVQALREEPRNAQQLALALAVDYTTVRHHLRVLLENRLIESSGEHYGQVYSLAPTVEARWSELELIVAKHRKRR